MLGERKTLKEYHPNGALWFITEIVFVMPMFVNNYMSNTQLRDWDGTPYLILKCEKYFDNSQFGWKLEWNESGELINKEDKAFRKDGTLIN